MTLAHRSGRIRGAFVVAGVVALLALPAAALASSGFTIKINAGHHPLADCPKTYVTRGCHPLSLNVYVTKGSRKLSGKIEKYEFLFEGQVVSTQRAGEKSNHYGDFTNGHWHDLLEFPAESAGEPLVLRVVVHTSYGTEHADWSVTPKKP
jgi:hypothetical protein